MVKKYSHHLDSDLVALFFTLGLDLWILLIIALIYWVYSCWKSYKKVNDPKSPYPFAPLFENNEGEGKKMEGLKEPLLSPDSPKKSETDPFVENNQSKLTKS